MITAHVWYVAQWLLAWEATSGYVEDTLKRDPNLKLGEIADFLKQQIRQVVTFSKALNLDASAVLAERMSKDFAPDTLGTNAFREMRELRSRVIDELQARQFLYVPHASAPLYKEPLNGWGDVPDKFPSAISDIEEAGKCIALGRYTASVLHLMRVLDWGIGAQAKALGVVLPRPEWGKLLDHIEKALRALPADPQKPADWKDVEQFHSEAATHFRHLKNAWRNAAMHGRDKYGEEEARQIYDNVRGFMRHIATRFAESADE